MAGACDRKGTGVRLGGSPQSNKAARAAFCSVRFSSGNNTVRVQSHPALHCSCCPVSHQLEPAAGLESQAALDGDHSRNLTPNYQFCCKPRTVRNQTLLFIPAALNTILGPNTGSVLFWHCQLYLFLFIQTLSGALFL